MMGLLVQYGLSVIKCNRLAPKKQSGHMKQTKEKGIRSHWIETNRIQNDGRDASKTILCTVFFFHFNSPVPFDLFLPLFSLLNCISFNMDLISFLFFSGVSKRVYMRVFDYCCHMLLSFDICIHRTTTTTIKKNNTRCIFVIVYVFGLSHLLRFVVFFLFFFFCCCCKYKCILFERENHQNWRWLLAFPI